MSTSQHQNPKSRKPRPQKNGNLQPGSGRQNASSDTDAYRPTVAHAQSDTDKGKHQRKHQSTKKGGGLTEDEFNRMNGKAVMAAQQESTPVKQAYAGALFQQSPAASALPLPSFYSKSVPNSALSKHRPLSSGTEEDTVECSPDLPMANNEPAVGRESTPLDWLFDAARKTKTPNRQESPTMSGANTPSRDSPAIRDNDGMFSFELEGAPSLGEDGNAFATPYKDRMETLRSTSSAGDHSRPMDEAERKAKSEELKRFLLKSQVQQNMQAMSEVDNPFNARPVPVSGMQRQSPPILQPQNNYNTGPQSRTPPTTNSNFSQYQNPHYRAPSSSLRNVYGPVIDGGSGLQSPNDLGLISTARRDHRQPQQSIANDLRSPGPVNNSASGNRQSYSNQQMEDDLRRILKLNATSNA